MKTTDIYKAQQIIKDEPVESRVISIRKPIPEFTSLDELGMQFANEGKMLADALFSCLPGGTLDCLLIEMLERKRSLFVINPYIQPTNKDNDDL